MAALAAAGVIAMRGSAVGPSPSWSGAGTPDDPYRITTAAGLDSLRFLNDGGAGLCFSLENDITADSTIRPIALFAGSLSGNGHSLTYSYRAEADSLALFTVLGHGSTVTDLTLKGSIAGNDCVAGLAARCHGKVAKVVSLMSVTARSRAAGVVADAMPGSEIDSCVNGGNVSARQSFAGGIAVKVMGGMKGCVNRGTVQADAYAGGIMSQLNGAATVSDCHNEADLILPDADNVAGIAAYSTVRLSGRMTKCTNSGRITARHYAGGIGARLEAGLKLDSCVNRGTIAATERYSGGILAQVNGDPAVKAVLSACANEGTVTTDGDYAGGLAGFCSGNVTIASSHNSGTVTHTGTGGSYIGGLCGMSFGEMNGCYNTGSVQAPDCLGVGGLAGATESGFSATLCYNTGKISAPGASSDGSIGIAGGLTGDARQSSFSNCFNLGTVEADEAVGGFCGFVHHDCHFAESYNAGTVTAHRGGYTAIGAIATYAPYAMTETITASAVYYDAEVCHRISVFDSSETIGLSTEQLCLTAPSGNFTLSPWCYPLTPGADPSAILASACIGFTNPSNNDRYVTADIYLARHPRLQWTLSRCFEFSGQNTIRPVHTGISDITVTETASGRKRSFNLHVVSYNGAASPVADTTAEWLTHAGIPVANPLPGNIYLRRITTPDGTTEVRKVVFRP